MTLNTMSSKNGYIYVSESLLRLYISMFQFMDFWLSFMAVISTFLYLTTIDEVFKRAIHTAVAILTALMAATKATRYMN